MEELKALQTLLSNDEIARHYTELFTKRLNDSGSAASDFKKAVSRNLERYNHIEAVRSRIADAKGLNAEFNAISRLFPSFGFIIANELDQRPENYDIARNMRLAVTASTISSKADFDANAQLFLNDIEKDSDLETLEQKLQQAESDQTYFPGVIHRDFILLEESQPALRTSTDPHDLIEILYYFQGFKQVFLKYMFYLLGNAQNDSVGMHIYNIFSRLLFSIRNHEIRYWKKFKNGNKLQLQLMNTIVKDMDKVRHPYLRKHIFDRINNFNPVIQNGSVRNTIIEVRKLLAKQLAMFHTFSIDRMLMLMDVILKTFGKNYVTYLLIQLNRTDNEKLFNMYDQLKNSNDEQTALLGKVVIAYTENLPRTQRRLKEQKRSGNGVISTIFKTAETLRKTHADENIKRDKDRKALTHDKVTAFLEERLKKLYERVKKEGALTQDKIPEYLARFTAAAESVMAPIPIGSQKPTIEEFTNVTVELLDEISSEGELSEEEVDTYRTNIQEKAEALQSSDVEERTNIVDEIGVTLTDASFESDKRKEEKERQEFFKKEIIPYGLDKRAKRISINDFFKFPFGDYSGPDEDDWFAYHMRYLQLAVKENRLDKSNFIKIFNAQQYIPRIKYKKYFNIFPNDQFEETTFMAVFDLWQNKAFDRLKESE